MLSGDIADLTIWIAWIANIRHHSTRARVMPDVCAEEGGEVPRIRVVRLVAREEFVVIAGTVSGCIRISERNDGQLVSCPVLERASGKRPEESRHRGCYQENEPAKTHASRAPAEHRLRYALTHHRPLSRGAEVRQFRTARRCTTGPRDRLRRRTRSSRPQEPF